MPNNPLFQAVQLLEALAIVAALRSVSGYLILKSAANYLAEQTEVRNA